MKPIFLALTCVLLVAAGGQVERIPHEETQLGMTEAAGKELHAAEAEMAALLQKLVTVSGATPEAVAKLKRAQGAWEAYRDAQIQALWPFPDTTWYGSVHPMCVADTRTALTKLRVAELRAMLKPVEGDVCGAGWPQ